METTEINKPTHKLGIALSGGGARGFAHIGALHALEEFGLKPDVIAGTSAGSIVAAMYSAGVPLEKMMSLFTDRKFSDFCEVSLKIYGNNGIFSLAPFEKFIAEAVAPYRNIEDLPIETYFGVTDFDRGTPAEFHTGEIAPRVVASCSIPICFKPVVIDGVSYVDGGVVRNLPAWIIRNKCEHLIGINVSPVLPTKTHNSMLDIAFRTYNLMAKGNQKPDQEMCDLSIETPEIAHYRVFNLKEIKKVYISGYATMRRAIKRSEWIQQYLSDMRISQKS